MKIRIKYLICCFAIISTSCKKAEDRKCWKSTGEDAERIVELDSVAEFRLYKNIKYRIVEDTARMIILKGGQNLLNQIQIESQGYELSVYNNNSCSFLRDSDRLVEAEIHYPSYKNIYVEPTDSVIVENTLHGNSLYFEIREAGGSAVLDVDVNFISINVSYGTGDYTLTGQADNAEVKLQNNGYCDATGFSCPYMFVYQNSTGDLKCNLQGTDAKVIIEGTGDVIYLGEPQEVDLTQKGSGTLLQM